MKKVGLLNVEKLKWTSGMFLGETLFLLMIHEV